MIGKTASILIVALAALSLLGCATTESVPSGPIVFERDSTVRENPEQGLDLKLLKFEWVYLTSTDQLKIQGWVQNQSGDAVQGGRIIIQAFDQFNYPLGQTETYLDPTYIPAEGRGRFDCYLHRGSWVTALHLVYRFETRF